MFWTLRARSSDVMSVYIDFDGDAMEIICISIQTSIHRLQLNTIVITQKSILNYFTHHNKNRPLQLKQRPFLVGSMGHCSCQLCSIQYDN